MSIRFAFVGFRHAHIRDMFTRCQQHADIEIVACCEQDPETREQLAREGQIPVTHENYEALLADTECDVIAIGDVYGQRGGLITRALETGRHVISDKPLCISLGELDQIEQLANTQGRIVSGMLDMRDLPGFLGLRELIRADRIGPIRAISFDGQHPLMYGTRPDWYFDPGMHGGTLNDIAIHAIDFIPWATGQDLECLLAARSWNANLPEVPHFHDGGQALLTLQNGAGVMGDVSYLLPDSFGYQMPLYWRFVFWGADGVLEAGVNTPTIRLYQNGEQEARELPLPAGKPGAYLEAFLAEIQGTVTDLHLSSAEVLRATRLTLRIQQAAADGTANLALCD